MIGIVFEFANQIAEVRIIETNIYFRNSTYTQFGTIDQMKLDKNGVVKEFPDLKDNDAWEYIARQRFKDKINKLNSEDDRADYIIKDLTKFGYIPKFKQKNGFRVQRL